MKSCKYTLVIVSIIALGITVYAVRQNMRNKLEKRLVSISDAGYETAFDILYPLKRKKMKKPSSYR